MTTDTIQTLIDHAAGARKRAYAPYSGYPVGAALRTQDGLIYTGSNVENASYSISMCAERTALFKAVSEGERDFDALVVITRDGGSPCGACRQALYEFAPELDVIIADTGGHVHQQMKLADLLPLGFGPDNLNPQNGA